MCITILARESDYRPTKSETRGKKFDKIKNCEPPPLLLIDIFAYKPRILIKINAFKLIKKRPMDHVAYVSKNCNVKIRFTESHTKRLDNVQFCIKIEPVENDFENFLRIF